MLIQRIDKKVKMILNDNPIRNVYDVQLVNIVNNKGLALNYPRMIVDSWDFNDKLGLELLDLAELYKRWK